MKGELNETMTVWCVHWQPLHTRDYMSGTWWEERSAAEYIAATLRDSRWVRNVTVDRLRVRVADFLKSSR